MQPVISMVIIPNQSNLLNMSQPYKTSKLQRNLSIAMLFFHSDNLFRSNQSTQSANNYIPLVALP